MPDIPQWKREKCKWCAEGHLARSENGRIHEIFDLGKDGKTIKNYQSHFCTATADEYIAELEAENRRVAAILKEDEGLADRVAELEARLKESANHYSEEVGRNIELQDRLKESAEDTARLDALQAYLTLYGERPDLKWRFQLFDLKAEAVTFDSSLTHKTLRDAIDCERKDAASRKETA